MEAEEEADREPDDPVGGEVDVESDGGVAGAAECSGGGHLEAVEELEDGDDEHEGDGGGDNLRVGGEATCDEAGDGDEHARGKKHKGAAEQEGGPA